MKCIRFIICSIVILALFGCSKERTNQKIIQEYQSYEHLPELAGWWNHLNNEGFWYYFDLKDCNILTVYKRPDGEWGVQGKDIYWYTSGDMIYSFRKATLFYGAWYYTDHIRFSEDYQQVYRESEVDGEWHPWLQREVPPDAPWE